VRLNRYTSEGLLNVVADRLHERGVEGRMTLVGVAALAWAYGLDRTDDDIDAVCQPAEAIDDIVCEMMFERDLGFNWLNRAVLGLVPDDVPKARLATLRGLTIDVVTPGYLLAMKILASRPGTSDFGDTEFLARKLGIKPEGEALDPFRLHFPEKEVPARAYENLGAAFGRIREESVPSAEATGGDRVIGRQTGRDASGSTRGALRRAPPHAGARCRRRPRPGAMPSAA
jgi:hypothetical protein